MNSIMECWFALLTGKQLRRGVHKNVQALERDIGTWITICNQDPRPFTWIKTADEILERLASYLNRIPDSGHYRVQSTQPSPWTLANSEALAVTTVSPRASAWPAMSRS